MPTVVLQGAEGVPLPSAPCNEPAYQTSPAAHWPLQRGSVLKDTHRPLPPTVTQCTRNAHFPLR